MIGLFVLPLLLVLQMSASKWPLLSGNQGWNFPANFTKAVTHRLFADSVVFTLKYTLLATVLLILIGLGLGLLVQESSRWKGFLRTSILLPSALGLASASLLFYVLYSPIAGPFAETMERFGISFLGTPTMALLVDHLPDRVALRRLLHAADAGGPAGHPDRRVRGRPHRRRLASGRRSATSPCRC